MNKKKNWAIIPNVCNAFFTHKYPVTLTHFVTQRCNARCPHCFVDFKSAENELNLEQIEKIASTTGPCLRNVAITGGEPFIRDDLFEIAKIWYKNSTVKSIVLPTNGSFPERIELFCQKAAKENLPISFFVSYDFIEEKHSQYRGLNNLHLKIKETDKIIKSFNDKFNLTYQITIAPNTYETALETYQYMRDIIQAQNINCIMIRGEKASQLDENTRKKIAEVYRQIQIQKSNDFDNKLIKGFNDNSLTSTLINAKNRMLWKYTLKTFVENQYISPCTAGSLFGIIYHDGSVAPCELLDTKLGNLKDFNYDFLECWHSLNANKIRREIKTSKCFCTDECSWLTNIFSSPRYFGELAYYIIKNRKRK